MKRVILSSCCLLLLTAPTLAQPPTPPAPPKTRPPLIGASVTDAASSTSNARDTEALLDAVYLKAGPELGCLLYEPRNVLTLGGLLPRGATRLDTPLSDASVARLADVNALLEPAGLHLDLDKDKTNLDLLSLQGLQRQISASKQPWLQAFDPASRWDGYREWDERTGKSAEAQGQKNLYYDFMRGDPDTALRAAARAAESAIDDKRRIRTDLPYAETLKGESNSFAILPEDAAAPDVARVMSERAALWKGVYISPSVRARFRDPAFLAARRQMHPKTYGSDNESWIRGADLRYALVDAPRSPIGAEALLIRQQDTLAALIKTGATPVEWQTELLQMTQAEGLPFVVTIHEWNNWIWYGAYPGSPARTKIYEAVKAARPEYLRDVAASEVKRWLEADDKADSYGARDAAVLFAHPDIKAYYSSAKPAEQSAMREKLNNLAFDIGVRALLAESPYAR